MITRTVLHVAEKFLSLLTPDLIELKTAERHLKHTPNSIPARHARGVALAKLGRYEDAAEDFQRVVKADPTDAKAYNNLGLALYHQRRFPQAIEAYQEAITISSDYADPHYNLACIYACTGEFEKCLEELERTKRLDGFLGTIDPSADRDFAPIQSHAEYGPRFKALVK
jgi:tetratricopeptide (TPR) repeat protein